MSSNLSAEYDAEYDYSVLTQQILEKTEYLKLIGMLYKVTYLFICVVGVALNFYVIIAGVRKFRSHRSPSVWEQHTCAWVLALAVTHLVFSGFLVLQFLYAWWHFNWHYGAALCKISSYVFYFSMFSTAALLSLMSMSSCVGSSECFKAVRFNKRGKSMVILMVLSSWTFGAVLSSPSLFSRELRYTELGLQCIDDFDLDKEKTTGDGLAKLTTVVLSRFLLGVLFPLFLMIISACIARLRGVHKKGTCHKIALVVKVCYFICWAPLLSMLLVQVKEGNIKKFKYGLPAATVLAAAHCFINPVIYLLVGRKTNMAWMLEIPDHKTKVSQNEDIEL
ncbi:chemerin-like receptor 1 [Astyanax mexicanus]|uniref:chemerin-like receptor 1 n=1 Tax=Astyanax mexicanus TaxID=7994 RepID=UPI0003CD32E8|nr:chemerin-like receptor 1 [Astyanax mexicanus]